MNKTLLFGLAIFVLFSFNFKLGDSLPEYISKKYSEISGGPVHLYQTYKDIKGFAYENAEDAAPIIVKSSSFFISKYEVTNGEYAEFLNAIRSTEDQEFIQKVRVDSSAWFNAVPYADGFVKHYHKHGAYKDHPVVNVSYEGANAYCAWFSEKIANEIDGDQKVHFRLPTREEWTRAARGDDHKRFYTWDEKDESLWTNYCNFNQDLSAEKEAKTNTNSKKNVVVVGTMNRLKSRVSVTQPVNAYVSNEFGLYNMNGNVAEMIKEEGVALGGCWYSKKEDVSLNSQMEYNGASPFIGFRPVMIIE